MRNLLSTAVISLALALVPVHAANPMARTELEYSLITLVTHLTGKKEMVVWEETFTHSTCARRRDRDNYAWRMEGDHSAFLSVTHICISKRKLP